MRGRGPEQDGLFDVGHCDDGQLDRRRWEKERAIKYLTSIVASAALALSPAIASAAPHGSGGGGHGGGGGGFHGGGGYRGGGGYHDGGGYHGGYYGGRGYYGFYGPAFGLYLGYYANPWLWGYPDDYYGYPYYPAYNAPSDAPPMAYSQTPQTPQAAPQPQACGSWQWNATEQQYHWMTNGCN